MGFLTILWVMTTTRSIADAKAHFADAIASAEAGEPVLITRHGKPVAAIIPAAALALLERAQEDSPEAGLAGIAGRWSDLDDWLGHLDRIATDRPSARPIPPLE